MHCGWHYYSLCSWQSFLCDVKELLKKNGHNLFQVNHDCSCSFSIGHFRVLLCLRFKMKIRVIFIRMVLQLGLLWNRGMKELGNGLYQLLVFLCLRKLLEFWYFNQFQINLSDKNYHYQVPISVECEAVWIYIVGNSKREWICCFILSSSIGCQLHKLTYDLIKCSWCLYSDIKKDLKKHIAF